MFPALHVLNISFSHSAEPVSPLVSKGDERTNMKPNSIMRCERREDPVDGSVFLKRLSLPCALGKKKKNKPWDFSTLPTFHQTFDSTSSIRTCGTLNSLMTTSPLLLVHRYSLPVFLGPPVCRGTAEQRVTDTGYLLLWTEAWITTSSHPQVICILNRLYSGNFPKNTM